jgi:hypothetical protein
MPEIEPVLKVGVLKDRPADSFPAVAHYRKGTSERRCGNCIHFLDGVCHFWDARARASMVCDDWKIDFADDGKNYVTMAEVFHPNGGLSLGDDEDGLIWKEALATGTWAMTPGPGQKPVSKPLIVKYDSNDARHISLRRLVDHFEERAVDHVTVPLSHADRVDENTGFVEKLKIIDDAKRPGHHKLIAGYRFTEPEIKQKVVNGSIANNSVGILFDYVRKRDGKVFPQVLAHIALTNRPWIDGLAPFGIGPDGSIAASEDVHVVSTISMMPMAEADPNADPSPRELHLQWKQRREARALELGSSAPLGSRANRENWVEKVGGLPPYVREVARSLMKKRGMTMSRAIATAISRIKMWAATSKNPKTRAKAAKAIAQWEAMKGKSSVKKAVNAAQDLVEAQNIRRLMLSGDDELFLARSFLPGWWKSELHPRWPKGHPKAGKFMTKPEIAAMSKGKPPALSKAQKGAAISASRTKRQKDVEYEKRLPKLTERIKRSVQRGQRPGVARTGARRSRSEYLRQDPGKGLGATGKTSQKALLDFVNAAATQPTTVARYSRIDPKTGKRKYDASRQELHDQIIDVFMRKRAADKDGKYTVLDPNGVELESVDQPSVLFSGGGYAAGKGSVIEEMLQANGELPGQGLEPGEQDNFLLLDPDQIKGFLPEFNELLETDPEANILVYEEAWDIAQEIQRRAQEKKLHMVVDGISNTSPEEFLARVKSFTDSGYVNPRVVYVDIPTDEALKRAANRARKAKKPSDRRFIPEVIMRAVHRDVAATIPEVLRRAPEYGLTAEVWDNNQGWNEAAGKGVPPKRIALVETPKPGATSGRPMPKIEDELLWQSLLMKGQTAVSGVRDPGQASKPLRRREIGGSGSVHLPGTKTSVSRESARRSKSLPKRYQFSEELHSAQLQRIGRG